VKVVLLSGGGGGARFARGLDGVLDEDELTVVANVGDDVEILGLHVSPDLDSLLYTLSGLIDRDRGWGRSGESWNALESAAAWGGEDWFRLGDRDIGLHLVRTRALRNGASLSDVTAALCARVVLGARLLPATDDRLRTHVHTPAGRFPFQEWFVGRRHEDEVDAVEYEGADTAGAAQGVLDAISASDAVLFAPSNPYLSLGPILAIRDVREAIGRRKVRCVAVSPLAGGEAFTGPAARMLNRMAGGTTPAHVARVYGELIDELVIDDSDAAQAGGAYRVASTRMTDAESERRLAQTVLEIACG
jgi:LPPG:FO 2-phospho-L-lactate transferase